MTPEPWLSLAPLGGWCWDGGEPLHPETHTWAQQLPCQCASKHCQEKEPNASYTIAGKETEVFVSLAEGEFGLCKGA